MHWSERTWKSMLWHQTHKSEILPSIKYKSPGNFTPKSVPWYAGYFKLKALEIQQMLEEAPLWYSVIYHKIRSAKENTIAFHPLWNPIHYQVNFCLWGPVILPNNHLLPLKRIAYISHSPTPWGRVYKHLYFTELLGNHFPALPHAYIH